MSAITPPVLNPITDPNNFNIPDHESVATTIINSPDFSKLVEEFRLKIVNIDGQQYHLGDIEPTKQFAYVVYSRLQLSHLKKTHNYNLKQINKEFQILLITAPLNLLLLKPKKLEELDLE